MYAQRRKRLLRVALVVVGGIFAVGVWPLMLVWPSGWQWNPPQSDYEQMIVGIYFVLGVFLILASRNPTEYRNLIWFTVWSSVVHAVIMAFQALADPMDTAHLWGDVPALLVVAAVLAWLAPREAAVEADGGPGASRASVA